MYVKVTRGGSMGGDFITEVKGPITSGSAVIPFDPAKDNDIVGALGKVLGREMFFGRHNLETGDGDYKKAQSDQCEGHEPCDPTMTWSLGHVLAIEAHAYVDGQDRPVENVTNYFEDEKTGPGGNLIVKYAWWHGENVGSECIITTRNIFIVGDNGKTIDRVR